MEGVEVKCFKILSYVVKYFSIFYIKYTNFNYKNMVPGSQIKILIKCQKRMYDTH